MELDKNENRLTNIAKICHEANKAYCESIGDDSQKHWDEAPEWQQASAVAGVEFRLENPEKTPEDQHAAWLDDKHMAGWEYGEVKDVEAKTHPCMVPYEELPEEQKRKDALFAAIVTALA